MSATIHRHLRPTPPGADLLPRPPAWTRQALCTRVGTPADWSPDPADRDAVAEAIAVCGQCPVRGLCLEDALVRPSRTVGTIRGGMTDDQRRSERRRRKRANPAASGRDTVPALEAVRMVRALAADGHPRAEVSLLAGVSLATVVKLREGTDVVEVAVIERIRAAYEVLRRRRPIETAHTSRARGYAAAQGWAPTAAWVGVDMASPEARPAVPEVRAA